MRHAGLTQRLLDLEPTGLWLGGYSGDASTNDFRNLVRDSHPMVLQGSGHAPVGIRSDGADSALHGWRTMVTGFARCTSIGTLLNATEGTILAASSVYSNSSTGLRGIFDTASASTGAVRLFTDDQFASLRWDLGGESAVATAVPGGANRLIHKLHLYSVAWRQAGPNTILFLDGEILGTRNRGVAPGFTDLDWAAINTNVGPIDNLFLATFSRFLNTGDQRAVYRAMMGEVGAGSGRRRLR